MTKTGHLRSKCKCGGWGGEWEGGWGGGEGIGRSRITAEISEGGENEISLNQWQKNRLAEVRGAGVGLGWVERERGRERER